MLQRSGGNHWMVIRRGLEGPLQHCQTLRSLTSSIFIIMLDVGSLKMWKSNIVKQLPANAVTMEHSSLIKNYHEIIKTYMEELVQAIHIIPVAQFDGGSRTTYMSRQVHHAGNKGLASSFAIGHQKPSLSQYLIFHKHPTRSQLCAKVRPPIQRPQAQRINYLDQNQQQPHQIY